MFENIHKVLERRLEDLILSFDPMNRHKKNVKAKQNYRSFVANK